MKLDGVFEMEFGSCSVAELVDDKRKDDQSLGGQSSDEVCDWLTN